ncbi:MAG: hypothetical protein ACXVZV_13120 [Terriglobales bacterium]
MKYSKTLLFALLLAFLPALVFAGENNTGKKDITISQTLQVGKQQLKPGDYTVRWTSTGDSANVTFVQNGKEKAAVPARFLQASNQSNATFETNTATGTPTLDRVYVKNGMLDFTGGTPTNANASPTGDSSTASQ